jgi:YebC/PmpR family DNA-binding regulatory protein
MSGHSKWASIKHKKGAADAKRGQAFTKIIKEITVAARMGGGDIEANSRLRVGVLKARAANMPKDNIDRAIKKGLGELEGQEMLEIVYEGYGPDGVAIMVDCLTDNKNRTAADIRYLFGKGGGNLGASGCVSYLFKRKGIITFDGAKYSEDKILEAALEAGAEDVSTQDGTIEVVTGPDEFGAVVSALEKAGFEHATAEIVKIPDTTVRLEKDKTAKAIRLIGAIDDHDDVQSVSSNLDIPDDYVPEE